MTEIPPDGQPISVGKRLAFIAGGLVLGLLAAEALTVLGYVVVRRAAFPRASYRDTAASIAGSTQNDVKPMQEGLGLMVNQVVEVIHPYLGYVMHPDRNPDVSPLGFPTTPPLVFEPSADRLVVGVVGGSFAAGFSWAARDDLAAAFEPLDREVVVVNLAMGGYKQPQQLLALTWALSLGAHFDVVLNLDGFNDIVLPIVANLSGDVNPFYPRRWNRRVSAFASPEEAVLLAGIAGIDQKRRENARRFLRWRLDRSVAMSLAWRSRDLMLTNRRARYAMKLETAQPSGDIDFLTHGPEFGDGDGESLYDTLAGYWQRCSEQINIICKGNGIAYYHLLQPNQYVEGSKSMSTEERQVAIADDHFYRESAQEGYPALRRHGELLEANGIRFADLTMIFEDVPEPIYVDDCCHINALGYQIIADRLREMVIADHPELDH